MPDLPAQSFRLSAQQRRAWFLEQAGVRCHAQCVLAAEGPLDLPRLQDAVRIVAERHEILRTAFRRRVGMKVAHQVPGATAEPAWLDADARESPQEVWAAEAACAFDLEAGPVLRLRRVPLAAERCQLLLTLPSLCADGRSLELLIREVVAAYGGAELPEEPLQYVDFAQWQADLATDEGAAAEAAREFWRQHGRASDLPLRLPFDETGSGGAEGEIPLPPLSATVVASLERATAGGEPALSAFLLACWSALLARLSARSEVVVAVVFDGRNQPDLESALGPYARWLPIAASCAPDVPVARLAGDLRRSLLAAAECQQYFDWEGSSGAVAAPGLPAAGFELQRDDLELNGGGVTFRLLRRRSSLERFKVLLSCSRRDGVELTLRYDAAVLARAEAERLAGELGTLLAHAVFEPETPVGRLRLLAAIERLQILRDFNPPSPPLPARTFPELFAAQAAAVPDAVAAVCGDRRLTYGELSARAGRLASTLRRLGVGPEEVVALFLERSLDVLVAWLAVLAAGGACAPFEAEQPQRRLGLLLGNLRPRLILAEEKLMGRLPGGLDTPVVTLESARMAPTDDDVASPACPENLAYVIFTSGSTGAPKGVGVEHRQLASYLAAILPRLGLPGASFATVSTFAADLGHTAIFPALATGGCLHVVTVETASDARAFADYFAREPIDCLKIVPSHLEALEATSGPERALPRRRLVLGGEASRWELIERVRQLRPDLEILNHYGPTETTVGVATYSVGGRLAHAATVPLGAPLANSRIHLLDADLEPVPIGAPGELYIGGAGLSRGFLSRPEATAERFVPDPFGTEAGARLYRSGDRARYLPGGEIEFLGRVDNQVKYHGFRVELNEIRTALNRHRHVRDSVVVVRKDRNGRDLLVCYYVSRQELEVGELRAFLGESLLEETLPNVFVQLRRLPLTLNGKINYDALPSLEEARQQPRRAFVAPRDATEALVAGIWREVLGLDRVSVDDNFFELGGHSLLATRVLARLRDATAAEVSLRSLFEAPTVAGLARTVALAAAAVPEVIPVVDAEFDRQLIELEALSEEEARRMLESQA